MGSCSLDPNRRNVSGHLKLNIGECFILLLNQQATSILHSIVEEFGFSQCLFERGSFGNTLHCRQPLYKVESLGIDRDPNLLASSGVFSWCGVVSNHHIYQPGNLGERVVKSLGDLVTLGISGGTDSCLSWRTGICVVSR